MIFRSLLISTLLLSGSLLCARQFDWEKEIRTLLDDQVAAWNRGDIDGYMAGYWNSDSTTFTSGGTITRGYNEVLARYRRSYDTKEKMGTLQFRELALRPLGRMVVIVTGAWELTRLKDKPWGRFTLIVECKPEGWRITQDHTSSADTK